MGRERNECVFSSNAGGGARELKLCNYQKKGTTQDSSHLHRTAQLFLNFLIQHNKQAQCALEKKTFLLAEPLPHAPVTLLPPAVCSIGDLICCMYSTAC